MESLQKKMCINTMSQLQLLDNKVTSDSDYQSGLKKKQEEIKNLRKAVYDLSEKKYELLQKLDWISVKRKMANNIKCESSLPSTTQHELIHQAASIENKRRLHYLISAQRCTGCTAEVTGPGIVRIRYETCYKGEYFEPFYLELKFLKKLKVCWHTIPAFVPLERVIEEYNKGKLQFPMMIHLIHMYLSAYIHRRQQTIEFNTKYIDFLNEDISTSHSYNIIQLVLNISPNDGDFFQVLVQLHYKDLQSTFPSSVKCSDTANLPVDRSRIKHAFMTSPIAEAFENIFLDQNSEQG